jgi:hypothetical protein
MTNKYDSLAYRNQFNGQATMVGGIVVISAIVLAAMVLVSLF